MQIIVPDEFYDFCLYIHQDSIYVYGPELQDWINGALQHMSPMQRTVLRQFVDHLLSAGYSDEQLHQLYRSTDAEMGIRSGIRHFFAMLRDTIDRNRG